MTNLSKTPSALRKYSRFRLPVFFCAFGWLLVVLTTRFGDPSQIVTQQPLNRPPDQQFTIIINTFHRLDLLQESVRHYSQCRAVNRIHVNWAESTTPPDLSAHTCCETQVTFALPQLTHGDTSLNTRFLPVPDLATDAVLNIDDDIIVSCAGLNAAFALWEQNREQLVGWFPRDTPRGSDGHYRYASKQETLLTRGQYTVALTKAAFMHRKWLELYSTMMPVAVREMVAHERNCEDIAMQFLVSSSTQRAPTFIWDHTVLDKGAWPNSIKGISSAGSSHMSARSRCLDMLHEAFPGLQGSLPVASVGSIWERLSPLRDAVAALSMAARRCRRTQCSCSAASAGAWQNLAQL